MSESETREAEEAAAGGAGEFDSIVFDSYRETQPVPLEKKGGFSLGRNGWKKAFCTYLKNCDHPDLQEEIYFQDEDFMVVYDGYPKARHHLLLLPKPLFLGAKQPSSLRDTDLPRLRRLHALGKAVAKGLSRQGAEEVRCGYHALPSMEPLHLHIISQDFNSPSMRKKHHWNIFTTDIFLEPHWVEEELERRGQLDLDVEKYTLLKMQMPRCHLCGQRTNQVEALKEHYRSHSEAQEIDAVQRQPIRPGTGSRLQQQNPGEAQQPAADNDSAGDCQPAEDQETSGKTGRKRRRRRAKGGQGKTAVEPGLPMEMEATEEGAGGPQVPARGLFTDRPGQEAPTVRAREGWELRQERLVECPREQGWRGEGGLETSVGGIGGDEWCTDRGLHGPGHELRIQENNGEVYIGGRWAGGPGIRANGLHEEHRQGWGSLGCYEDREPTTRWPSAKEGMGGGRHGSYEKESIHLPMSGRLGARRAGHLDRYTGGAGPHVPQGNQDSMPRNGGPRRNDGWRGEVKESAQRHGWRDLPGSHPVGTKGDRDGWHGRGENEPDGQRRLRHEWREDPRQEWNNGAGWCRSQRSPGMRRERERGGDAWHGLREVCGDGQAKAGQGQGQGWPEAGSRADWFGVPGLRGAGYGREREGQEEQLWGTCVDGSGRNPRGQDEGSRGMSNSAGWYGGRQLRVQDGGNEAGHEAWGTLRGRLGDETGREDNPQGRQLRGERIWTGSRDEREQIIRQEEGNEGGRKRWQGIAGGASVDGQGEIRGNQGFGNVLAGGHGHQVWHGVQEALRASVGGEQREQHVQRGDWMGGRADGGWCGGGVLQGRLVQGREGRGQRVDDDLDHEARVRARWAEDRLNGSEHHSRERVRVDRIGAVNDRTMEGTRGRLGKGQEDQGVDRNALGGRGKRVRTCPPEKLS